MNVDQFFSVEQRESFQQMVLGKLDIPMQINKAGPFCLMQNINVVWIKDQNEKLKL